MADAEARAKFEIDHQIDMRSRAVISRSILTAACVIIGRRYRFSGRKGAHLCDVAMRVLLMDVGNAIASHTNLGVSDDKARSDEAAAAVEDFGQAVKDVRAAVIDATKSLQETSHRLSARADATTTQARAASAAADDSETGIEGTAAATREPASTRSPRSARSQQEARRWRTTRSPMPNPPAPSCARCRRLSAGSDRWPG